VSRYFTRSLDPYVPGEQPEDLSRFVKLNTNENPYPPSERALAFAREHCRPMQLYSDLNARYYAGIIQEPLLDYEWMRIPHFYSAFYVYVYATGLCAAVSLSEKILQDGAPAVADYRKFLSAGCSVPPIEALKLAGIDMSSPEPVRLALEVFRETVEKMKAAARILS